MTSVNRLRGLPELRNAYFAVRHGHSEANAANTLIGDPLVGTRSFGLTKRGIEDVRRAFEKFKQENKPDVSRTLIIASDFLRTIETATEAAAVLGLKMPVVESVNLRERGMGDLEGQPIETLARIYVHDDVDPSSRVFNAESLASVFERLAGEVENLERQFSERTLLLVSHRDPLQVLEAAFLDVDLRRCRSVVPMELAGIRKLERQAL